MKGKPSAWLTQPIKNEMNFRDNLLRKARKSKKESDWLTYKKKKNHVNNLIKHLKGLKRKKSDGIDQIPACLLKDCANELAPPIACLINTILKTSKIPNGFKVGKVTPIYKSGEKSLFDNYAQYLFCQ